MRNQKINTSIILLHGWGLRGSIYIELVGMLERKGYRVYSPDLPGFGSEPLRKKSMVLDDYVIFLDNFIKKHSLQNIMLIGHSFGGRVAIKYVWRYPKKIKKLVLTGVPVIRNASFKRKFAYMTAVIGGKIFSVFPQHIKGFSRKVLYRTLGEWDYYKSGPLKQVFKNIIAEDLVEYTKQITVPVLLVWGKEDGITPVSDIEKIRRLMPQATSVVIANVGHKAPYETPKEFFNKVEKFLI